jgi:hypothetical protein
MKSQKIEGLVFQLKMQGRLFKNVIEDLESTETSTLIHPNSVHLDWLIGHIVAVRYGLSVLLDVAYTPPTWMQYFDKGKGMQDVEYPTISEYKTTWDELQNKVLHRLENISDKELDTKNNFFPVKLFSNTVLEAAYFFAHHESYHIGQIGISRKILGHKAMKYSEPHI